MNLFAQYPVSAFFSCFCGKNLYRSSGTSITCTGCLLNYVFRAERILMIRIYYDWDNPERDISFHYSVEEDRIEVYYGYNEKQHLFYIEGKSLSDKDIDKGRSFGDKINILC